MMTPEDQEDQEDAAELRIYDAQQAERNAVINAVAHALTDAQAVTLAHSAADLYGKHPGFPVLPARTADLLSWTVDYDEYLELPELQTFARTFAAQLPAGFAAVVAAHALVLAGILPTPGRVWALAQRAGVVDAPRYPDVTVGLRSETVSALNSLSVIARAERALRMAGVLPENEIAGFRASVRHTGVPGHSRNMADIAAWVTLADENVDVAPAPYDPAHDLAVVLFWAATDPGDPDFQALANLREHVGMHSVEEAEEHIRAFFARGYRQGR